jgi:UDP-N-acetylmuramoyl-tripeptide--D-alanyl-D-alanine ligase
MKSFFKRTIVAVLRWEAQQVLKKYHPRIIAVTGSVGKTSTKDAIFAVLSQTEHVRKSDKSFNSEIGLPLTILGRPNAWSNPLRWLQNILDGLFLILLPTQYPHWLVLEVGADRPGDIKSLASWLVVDVAVITRLPDVPVHVEYFDSPEAVVEEKASLIRALRPEGTLIVYADDARTDMLAMRAKEKGAHVITFGLSDAADVRGINFSLLQERGKAEWPIGMSVDAYTDGTALPLSVLGVIGAPPLLSIIAASAVGKALGKNMQEIAEGVRLYEPPKGRMRILPGIKRTLVIDDTYNSSPAASEAALDALNLLQPPVRKIAVLGDMLELGKHSVEEHRKIGAYAARTANLLVTVGVRARDIAAGALDAGMRDETILQFEDALQAGEALQALVQEGDCVLVKGSQGVRTERIVERLMDQPERASELLVRQEKDWRKR